MRVYSTRYILALLLILFSRVESKQRVSGGDDEIDQESPDHSVQSEHSEPQDHAPIKDTHEQTGHVDDVRSKGAAGDSRTYPRYQNVDGIAGEQGGTNVDESVDKGLTGDKDTMSSKGYDESKEPAQDLTAEGAALIASTDSYSKSKGYITLQRAADLGNSKAKELLAYGHIFGLALPRNFTYAFEVFTELAELGIPAGQFGLGFMFATGLGVSSNQAKALLNYVFAALGGHHYAQMAMGYRSLMGISVVRSCESSLSYYYKVAKKVVSESSLITGGHAVSKVRVMDEENEAENVLGVSETDMISYHSVFADSGNSGAQLLLGMFYMYGMAGAEKDFLMALQFLQQASDSGYPAASALIGKIYTEGSEDVPKNYVKAKQYFEMAADQNNGDGYSGLGMMYLNGFGVDKSYTQALKYFQKAADRGSAEGQYYLGYMLMNGYGTKKDKGRALSYFQLAAHGGHLHAIFNLGEMNAEGKVVKRNCNFAVELFKSVAERGRWSYMFMEALQVYDDGDVDSSLMMYMFLAELGMEVAQSNAAFLLEQDDVSLVGKEESLKRALAYWNRAAAQGYVDARVKLGDYYYYGHGTEVNYEASASQYRMASDKQASPQAMFNLGYMYENGLGLEKDYHLAKRYYDMAAETSADAIIPVNLALLKMNAINIYEYLGIDSLSSRMESLLGEQWDIYLISIMSGLVVLVMVWRRHQQ